MPNETWLLPCAKRFSVVPPLDKCLVESFGYLTITTSDIMHVITDTWTKKEGCKEAKRMAEEEY